MNYLPSKPLKSMGIVNCLGSFLLAETKYLTSATLRRKVQSTISWLWGNWKGRGHNRRRGVEQEKKLRTPGELKCGGRRGPRFTIWGHTTSDPPPISPPKLTFSYKLIRGLIHKWVSHPYNPINLPEAPPVSTSSLGGLLGINYIINF